MKLSTPIKLGITAALVLTMLLTGSSLHPAQALGLAVGHFWAGCGNFSLDLAVTGTSDDGGGVDSLRYEVQDNSGHVLYREDAGVRVGTTVGSLVFNLFYQNNAYPSTNPIWLYVQDLSASGNKTIAQIGSEAPCIAQAGNASTADYVPPNTGSGTMIATTRIYEFPGLSPVGDLVVRTGEGKNVIYRTPDNTWVAVWVGGGELVWVPTSTISVNISQLTIPPTRIQGSGLTAGMNEANHVAGQASLLGPKYGGFVISSSSSAAAAPGSATARGNLNMHALPRPDSDLVDAIPGGTALAISGRNSNGYWLKVTYNNKVGWVSSYYVNLTSDQIRSLPVVQ